MNGIILLNKRKGYTSQEELDNLKKIVHEKKIGHTGTLDPIATGVLVVLLGKYTKLSEEITSEDKEYIATVKIGLKTDSLDITGKIIEEKKETIDKEILINVINSFKKTYEQEVPLYSSVRIEGKHLYEYAREGILIKLPKRKVTIYDIELIDVNKETFTFRVKVSKGTYIRSLIRDICKQMGIIGTMSDLKRIKQGVFSLKDSFTIDEIEQNNYKLIDIENVFDHEKRKIEEDNKKYIMSGNLMKRETDKDYVFFYEDDILKVIYKVYDKDNSLIKPILFL